MGWPTKRDLGRHFRDLGKLDGIFPYEHSVPPTGRTGMKNVQMRMRRRNYVTDFSNFQVNISINVKFHPGRRYERKRNLSRLAAQLGYRDHSLNLTFRAQTFSEMKCWPDDAALTTKLNLPVKKCK